MGSKAFRRHFVQCLHSTHRGVWLTCINAIIIINIRLIAIFSTQFSICDHYRVCLHKANFFVCTSIWSKQTHFQMHRTPKKIRSKFVKFIFYVISVYYELRVQLNSETIWNNNTLHSPLGKRLFVSSFFHLSVFLN